MSSPTIAIVDYQAGNLRSVQKALERFGANAVVTSDPKTLERAHGIVFPGQGASDPSMCALRDRALIDPIRDYIKSDRPFMGVCLGLQLLLEVSDEGVEPGLGVIPGRVKHLPGGLKVPHMGWNDVQFRTGHPVLNGVPDGTHFYFVHSYFADPADESIVAGTTRYGVEFCSVAAKDNWIAFQFHPEKSGAIGLKLYQNFVELVGLGAMRD
ncbi:MAG: imidazole glycerol phosphate synthase subunit HisH [Chloroflexi bacterium]|nr:imidazole glycerol phosphate synthase subunit HisH [Chloroflexota bacterium]